MLAVVAVSAALLSPVAVAVAAPAAAKARPCKKGQVRKKGRCVRKPAKKKPAKPATPAPVAPTMPTAPLPSSNGPTYINTIGFNNALAATRLYRKDATGLETWDFCRNGHLNYHGEIPAPNGDVNITDWQGSFYYSSYAYTEGDILEGVVPISGPDPNLTQVVIDFYPANPSLAVMGKGPGQIAVFLRQPEQAQGC